ncbi:LacI family transcriptional regulator [Microbacterium sp. ru370.1]|uniref:LacI family DNA-binding transcriptional regulator n=1 Tax=unclassified Microbacterium TaxID=2609290 RepID=UPI00088DB3B0|nr:MULTISPECIES: LacI family DNA-binding transcriptional regulator [unclassified Microbacterium]SDO84020.1 LacI family transcriptional regulator [Microbacterium sp. ru370.1]SIT90300.1 LacI family transcriptional regulator [Microbacterium sp. RU1D]
MIDSAPPDELATLADVASEAGVSTATVSRALSGSRPVSPDTLKRVRAAAARLGYRHNAVASALRSNRTQSVGIVLPRYATVFLSALIESVTESLDAQGIGALLRYVAPDGADHDERVADLLDRRVDGLIVCPPTIEASGHAQRLSHGLPMVQVGRFLDPDTPSAVSLDETTSAALLATHLARTGTQRIITIGLDPDAPADATRIRSVEDACAARGIARGAVVHRGSDLLAGVTAAEELWDTVARGETLVCANDDVATGVLTVLRARGIRVPDDVQIASLLQLYPDAQGTPLTSLRHPWRQMGAEAVEMLEHAQRSRVAARRRTALSADLVVGASTRPPEEET